LADKVLSLAENGAGLADKVLSLAENGAGLADMVQNWLISVKDWLIPV
jgi:hypothetical protein